MYLAVYLYIYIYIYTPVYKYVYGHGCGPVVTALLFAGRAGSSLTAEIGLMKATEQLSSFEMMGVDPLRRVIAPRFIAGVICLPLLSLIFSATGIVGGLVGAFLGLQKLPESMVSKTLSFDCEHIQIRNNKPLGILRPALFNQKTRLIPSIQALIKLRAKPNDKLKITEKEVKEF